MTLATSLSIATSGLLYTQRALAVAADNITNASTVGYTRKSVPSIAEHSGLQGIGVRAGIISRDVDQALVNQINRTQARLAAATTREAILSGIEVAHGQTGQSDSFGDRVATLRTSFINIRADPGTSSWQSNAVLAAEGVVDRLRTASTAVAAARQRTQDDISTAVDAVNTSLRSIVGLTQQIRDQRSLGLTTAGLEDGRDAAIAALSENIPVKALFSVDGGVSLLTYGGQSISIPTIGDPLATSAAVLGPPAFYGAGGTIPAITLYGVDVTRQVSGGRIGELIALRDTTLPRFQAELDIAAANLAARFDAQGLALFVDASGNVPDPSQPYAGSALMGVASTLRVNPAILADPSLLRDGTHSVADSPTGASAFTPNAPGGPAGFNDLLDRVLGFTFGIEAQAGVAWGAIQTSGLGPDGTLTSPFIAPASIQDFSALVTASHTGDRAAATAAKEDAQLLAEGLVARFAERAGVDVDREMALMVTLQNAYAANARVISVVQTMWDALIAVVR